MITKRSKILHQLVDEAAELKFLRYFYNAAGEAFGPADTDIYAMIADDYDGELPPGYHPYEDKE